MRPTFHWRNLAIQLAVALAFADASIVVLALPEVILRLHTSISYVIWVIMAYNLALIVTSLAVIRVARRVASTPALCTGLAIFGVASIGCGLANSMAVLIPFRSVQGVGGGILLCASLPVFVEGAGRENGAARGWSAAAAIGIAVGPAAGGVLTQIFDWRAIFLAQAPVAAIAIALVLRARSSRKRAGGVVANSESTPSATAPSESVRVQEAESSRSALDPFTANVGLTLLSAGLIAALFLVVLMLIDVWKLTPIAAAGVVSTIPLATALAERFAGERRPVTFGVLGAVLVAGGLFGLSFITHRELALVLLMLALVGTGLGLAFPPLTTAALRTRGLPGARAAKTVSARDAGIVLGLLILTPVFVNRLHSDPAQALPTGENAVLSARLPRAVKLGLAPGLLADYEHASSSQLPDFTPTFAKAEASANPHERATLSALQKRLDLIVEMAVTKAFKLPLRYGALLAFAVLVLVGLGMGAKLVRRRDGNDAQSHWRGSPPAS